MKRSEHTFHIPIMGIAFTLDSPIKVARFGISSVVSIVEDHLIEQMRKFYCEKENEEYIPIELWDNDSRARRITAYLNLMNKIIKKQMAVMKLEAFEEGSEIDKYFELLPENSSSKKLFLEMLEEKDERRKVELQSVLREKIIPGSIDVNIMTKCDKTNYTKSGEALPFEFSDALSALRGYALSDLSSSVVFSAGLNPRLYSYCSSFKDFAIDETGESKKRIILKVSDYRSALIQGKFFAKNGLWVSEFRMESGLNCGGHAFPTAGFLLGPIMEEFKEKRASLATELFDVYKKALEDNGTLVSAVIPPIDISVQGGIGTSNENDFLLDYYKFEATGWGSPFLLVPEATAVDDETLDKLCNAKPADYYLSHASPLGVPFNNLRTSSSNAQRDTRIDKKRPGSPCYKKFLSFNTEYTEKPICVASREYQIKKIKEIEDAVDISEEKKNIEIDLVMEKDCLCEGLGASIQLKNEIKNDHKLTAVAICPGPNLAYFSSISSLKEMVDHIYGRRNLLNAEKRPSMFIKELTMYVDYLKNEISKTLDEKTLKQKKYFEEFKINLLAGVDYYVNLLPKMRLESENYLQKLYDDLITKKSELLNTVIA